MTAAAENRAQGARWREQRQEPRIAPPRHPPQSISPHTFLHEVLRLLSRHGINAQPEETNAASALVAAGRLLLALGVTPDVDPADRSEGAQRIREMRAGPPVSQIPG